MLVVDNENVLAEKWKKFFRKTRKINSENFQSNSFAQTDTNDAPVSGLR
jgi:hypothetical protein